MSTGSDLFLPMTQSAQSPEKQPEPKTRKLCASLSGFLFFFFFPYTQRNTCRTLKSHEGVTIENYRTTHWAVAWAFVCFIVQTRRRRRVRSADAYFFSVLFDVIKENGRERRWNKAAAAAATLIKDRQKGNVKTQSSCVNFGPPFGFPMN